MKYIALIFFAVMCCFNYSCKKKAAPVLGKQDTIVKLIDTVVKYDSNYLYAGVYNMYVHYHSYHDGGPGRVDYDTMYWCKMNIEYKPSDSIVSAVSISYTGTIYYYYKHPLLILTNLDNGIVYRKLGLDTMGRIRNGKSVENYTVGGFVNRDSINCYLFTRGNHEGENDTLIGHKIP
jgi:hypothetical protein